MSYRPWSCNNKKIGPEGQEWDFEFQPHEISPDCENIEISLPHQCEDWVIAAGPLKYVEAEMEKFIARAQKKLDEIKAVGSA